MSNTTALDIEEVMVPDTQERYPSEEQVLRWLAEQDDPDFTATTAQKITFIARKACDWQAHQCREQAARWMMDHGYATGHGDTIEDLLGQIVWQVRERDALNTPPPLPNQEQPND